MAIRAKIIGHPLAFAPENGPRRHVAITSIRRRLITDDANLRGGAKGLVDALVHAGVIRDDDDKTVEITYEQRNSSIPLGIPAETVIAVTEEE